MFKVIKSVTTSASLTDIFSVYAETKKERIHLTYTAYVGGDVQRVTVDISEHLANETISKLQLLVDAIKHARLVAQGEA